MVNLVNVKCCGDPPVTDSTQNFWGCRIGLGMPLLYNNGSNFGELCGLIYDGSFDEADGDDQFWTRKLMDAQHRSIDERGESSKRKIYCNQYHASEDG